jgi:hypothetical protein
MSHIEKEADQSASFVFSVHLKVCSCTAKYFRVVAKYFIVSLLPQIGGVNASLINN